MSTNWDVSLQWNFNPKYVLFEVREGCFIASISNKSIVYTYAASIPNFYLRTVNSRNRWEFQRNTFVKDNSFTENGSKSTFRDSELNMRQTI